MTKNQKLQSDELMRLMFEGRTHAVRLMDLFALQYDDEGAIKIALETATQLIVASMLVIADNKSKSEMYKVLDTFVRDVDERIDLSVNADDFN